MESQLELIEKSFDEYYSNWVYEALDDLPDNFTITDPCISGHPIVFASRGCLRMFGYSKDEVVGRNGRMFQGEGTCRRTVMQIREAIREERSVEVSLLNYRKDGTPFWMLFRMSPVFSEEDGKAIHFVAVQVPILRRPKHSRSSLGRDEFCLCQDGISREILMGSCRKEVSLDSMVESNRCMSLDAEKGVEVDELCGATEPEKQKATTAINNILSVLTQYGALRKKSVSGKRCNLERMAISNSALLTSLGRIKQSFVLIDPLLPSMPIVYTSKTFLKLTGYARHEVLGQRHRFLSGSETDSSTLLQIAESIRNGKPCKVRVLDYRKDTSSFWNQLHISPIRNAFGKIAYFIEVHMAEDCANDQDGQKLPELKQLGAIAAAKVAVRSATMGSGSSS
ncbi:hypothetical protein KSS87_002410 [Heliosperma pusillum]|nr:hypothetical protein KSS87_002410 [Heliosperma pusillum]